MLNIGFLSHTDNTDLIRKRIVEGGVLTAVEAGTFLGYIREVAVTADFGLRIGFLKILQKEPEGCLLLRSASIGITAFLIKTSDVADSNSVLIVVLDMSTGILLRTALLNGTILQYHPVIATAGPVLGAMTAIDIFDGPMLGRARA